MFVLHNDLIWAIDRSLGSQVENDKPDALVSVFVLLRVIRKRYQDPFVLIISQPTDRKDTHLGRRRVFSHQVLFICFNSHMREGNAGKGLTAN